MRYEPGFRLLTNLPDNEELEFKHIVKKLVMLFLILGAHRKQAIFTIHTD